MRAIVQHRYGGPERLELAELPVPEPKAGEVRVRVRAAGVDAGTAHLMTGIPYLLRLGFGLRGPRVRTPGLAFAGTVDAVGAGVDSWRPGDEVLGSGTGAFAEFVTAKAGALVARPASLGPAEAAALPISAVTALQAVRREGRVAPGSRVLVTGAGGGVGSFAVQLAVAEGAEVTAVCSPAKTDFVRSLGATHVVDYTREDITAGAEVAEGLDVANVTAISDVTAITDITAGADVMARPWEAAGADVAARLRDAAGADVGAPPRDPSVPFDVIIDIAGSRPLRALRRILTPRGTLVVVGGEGGPLLYGLGRTMAAALHRSRRGQTLRSLVSTENARDLGTVVDLVTTGRIRAAVGSTHPLENAPAALRELLDRRTLGKTVLLVSEH